jgi:peptidylprolyl isomerase
MNRTTAPLLVLLLAACAHREPPLPASIPPVAGAPHTAFALRWVEVDPGSGAPVEPRRCLYVHYSGWLRDGTRFDSSRDTAADGTAREPIAFPQGFRRVIAGWEAGFEGLRVGGRRRLFIPYQLAYGEPGRPPVIPPRAELIFDVEVMAVADTLPRADPGSPAPRCPPWREVSAGG